jgi:hypothetical protein
MWLVMIQDMENMGYAYNQTPQNSIICNGKFNTLNPKLLT